MRDLSRDSTDLYVKELTQTFLDNVIIESVQDVTRRWHRPTRRLETPLISKDRPLGTRALFYLFELLRPARPAGWAVQVLV